MAIFLVLPALTHAETAVQAWVQRYRGPGNASAYPTAMTVDSSNNVIVSAHANITSGGYLTIKYSSAGVPVWTNRYNGPATGENYTYAAAVAGSNNVIVTGLSMGTSGFWDYATIKYSSAGIPLWTHHYNNSSDGDDYAKSLAVDHSGNVIVTGGVAF